MYGLVVCMLPHNRELAIMIVVIRTCLLYVYVFAMSMLPRDRELASMCVVYCLVNGY